MATQTQRLEVHSPEESYRVLPVLYGRSWVAPAIFAGIVVWLLGFLLFGRIDIDAKGNAILLLPEAVVPFQSNATGQVGKWYVKVGDHVEKGQLLAIVDQPLIEKDLAQAQEQLGEIQERNKVIHSLTDTDLRLEKESLVRKRKMLTERIAILKQQASESQGLTQQNASANTKTLDQQKQNLEGLLELEKRRLTNLETELKRAEDLRLQQLRSADEVVTARQAYSDQVQKVMGLELQSTQLSLSKTEADESELRSFNRVQGQEDTVADLNEQFQELANQEVEIDQTEAQMSTSQSLQVRQLQRTVEQLQKQLTENREIHSEQAGRIVELTAADGSLVTRGQRLGAIDTGDTSRKLQAVAYFKVEDGKRIQPGTRLLLTPATVTRERYGSAVAHVTSVSRFPVSTEGAAKVVGNATVARTLTDGGYQIAVIAQLDVDPKNPSGYKWDLTSGPATELTSGTIAAALGTIETRAPITFIIPMLQ
ncbi:MAG TPA: NHLP bacteriocin system secretion protein [Terriglobia bacterium]|jgi:HlyD family secretion protein